MKCTEATIAKRVEEIVDLRLLGATAANIRQYALEQKWNVSERNVYRYLADADKLIAKSNDKSRAKLLAWHQAARRALYARCMAVSDYGTAHRVMKDEAELLNLYPVKETKVKTEHSGKDGAREILIKTIEVIHDSDPAPTDDGPA
jgi:hypothetical protein